MPWCCAREHQVGEKASYLVTSCHGGGEFIMMPLNNQHANLLNIEEAHEIFGGLILERYFLVIVILEA